ncbi:MAG: carboxypeptidase regulatory-like domain-containing protein [Bryobacterales bacterium]|nr:carboxypeptidase regulatory-like domain-containing protein [Acidobacteriota bacterium]MCB9385446.1 carboxypeptidase regulatory-like domain-containing protein [Bryobacterales bacterium]
MFRLLQAGLLVAMFAGAPLFAQTFGQIEGSVTDSSGATIAGAKITITNAATGVPREVESNEAGNYSVPFLNPGIYSITAELEGFKTARVDGRQVQVGDVQRVNIILEVGAVTEVIEVQAGAEMLDTSSTALGTVIDQQRIVELPINGRNYLSLVKLSPNVSAEMGAGGQADGRQGGERANQPLSISGQRQQFNRFTLDGIDNTDSDFNTFVVRPSVEALQEFKVQTGVYSAEYGKATSQINVTTRAGSNEFHGSLFEFLRNDKIQARPWRNAGDKAPFRRNQFGGTVTGPIVRNKFFFMGNYEGLRERVYGFNQTTTADQAMRDGDFSNPALLTIYDPDTIRLAGNNVYTADPFPNQQIPQARFKQPFIKLLEFLPLPNIPGAVTGKDPNNFTRNTPRPVDWDQLTTRFDFSENANSQWFGRYSWGREFVGLGATFPIQDRNVSTRVDQIMLSNTRTFSPTIVNELRLGANIFDNDLKTLNNGVRDVSGELNIPGMPAVAEAAWGSPQVGMSGVGVVAGWGESTEGPFINRSRTYQLFDNLSIIRGNHTFKFGGEVGNRRYNVIGNQFPRGLLQFHSRATALPTNLNGSGDRFASGLLGWMDEATRALGLPNVQLRQTAIHVYAEDTWKVTPKLTLTMGLRYENTPPWADRYRGMMNVKLFCPGVDNTGIDEACPTPVMVRPGDGDFYEGLNVRFADNIPVEAGDNVLYNHALQARDNNDFAPRIGIAYQLNQKTSIRTGWGVFYTQDTTNPVFDRARNFGFRESARGLDVRPSVNLDNPWQSSGASGLQCTNWDGVCVARLYTFAGDPNRRTPYVQQFMFNVQHQLNSSTLIEVGYSGNLGRKIERMYGYNTPLDKAGPDDKTTRLQRIPWGDAYGRIQTINNVVNSNYNALGLKFQKRFTQGMTYLVGYTWGRAIDYGSALRTNNGDNLFPQSSYNLHAERGLSQFHTKHRLTASVLYELPFKFENNIAEAVAGGWQMGSIITISTGTPFNGGDCTDLDGNEQGNRGDATGISPFLDNPTDLQFFAKSATGRGAAAISCFVADPTDAKINQLSYRQGNIARNMYIGPGFGNWDFSLSKNFRVTEGSHVEFRFESFNFANHPQWNFPDTGTSSLNYGVITSARTMRTNQFALKFLF